MTDNPWLPIDTMPLSTVGTDVDVLDGRRLYSGVEVSGLRLEHEVIASRRMDGHKDISLGPTEDFTLTHLNGTIRLTRYAQWRPHV